MNALYGVMRRGFTLRVETPRGGRSERRWPAHVFRATLLQELVSASHGEDLERGREACLGRTGPRPNALRPRCREEGLNAGDQDEKGHPLRVSTLSGRPLRVRVRSGDAFRPPVEGGSERR